MKINMELVVKDYQIKQEAGKLLELTVVYGLRRHPYHVTPEIIAKVLKRVFEGIKFDDDFYPDDEPKGE